METKSYRESLTHVALKTAEEPEWLTKLRQVALIRFQEFGFPSRRDEAWKYFTLEPLLNSSFTRAPREVPLNSDERAELERHCIVSTPKHRRILVNGTLHPKLSSMEAHAPHVLIQNFRSGFNASESLLRPSLGFGNSFENNPFVFINTFEFEDGLFVQVPANVKIEEPLHLVLAGKGQEGEPPVFYPRILISLGESSEADFVIHQISLGNEKYFSNSVVEIELGKSARSGCLIIQEETKNAIHFMNVRSRLAANSNLEVTVFSQGAGTMRNDFRSDFAGAEANSELRGLSLLSGDARVYHHAAMHHRVPSCRSRQVQKNILTGRAQVEFNSLSYVYREAPKSDSYQLNRNLLLSPEAHAYSRPQLKIYIDDVAAAHGSATGQLEEEELFYLRSRGLSELVARYVLTFGFAEELLKEMKPQSFYLQLELAAKREIERMVGSC